MENVFPSFPVYIRMIYFVNVCRNIQYMYILRSMKLLGVWKSWECTRFNLGFPLRHWSELSWITLCSTDSNSESLCHSLSPQCSICVVQWVDLPLTISPLFNISPFLNMSPLVNIADTRPHVSDETTGWWGRRMRGPNDRSDVILSYLDIHTTDWLWWCLVLAEFPSFSWLPPSVRSNLSVWIVWIVCFHYAPHRSKIEHEDAK